MRIIGIIFLIMFIWIFLCGDLKIDGKPATAVGARALLSLIASVVLTIILGLPMLGIVYLITH